MTKELLEIHPEELSFTFELKKQSSCSIRFVNNSHQFVAYKVKTTSPKKYSVRPNVGIVMPNSDCEAIVTMQAQRVAPTDMVCKDKFLVQTTVVPDGTTDEDITPMMFVKNEGKYVEEKKLRVVLISPPHSPELSTISVALKQGPTSKANLVKEDGALSGVKIFQEGPSSEVNLINEDESLSGVEIFNPHQTVAEEVEESKTVNREEFKEKDIVLQHTEDVKDLKLEKDKEMKAKLNELELVHCKEVTEKDIVLQQKEDVKDLKLEKDINVMKSKLSELESKLNEAEVTILKLTEERRLSTQERETLKQELAMLRNKKAESRVHVGFRLLFVCIVALLSVMLGYILHR